MRNCDVGTHEEQYERFHTFCVEHSSRINDTCNRNCPCIDCFNQLQCICKWAQMPYETEEY